MESWLRRNYPNSTVSREEYTNEQGERRADVLLVAADGTRVAFEIQYSPLTPEAWQRRHDSYRAQGIVDVWLFGHGPKQLRLDQDGLLRPNPTHEAVVRSGSALLFINPAPERQEIAVAVGRDFRVDSVTGGRGPAVSVVSNVRKARLEVASVEVFRAHRRHGLTSNRLSELYLASHALPGQQREARIAADDRRRQVRRESEQARALKRESVRAIRHLLNDTGAWEDSRALDAIDAYFGARLRDLRGRIDVVETRLVRWQCLVYFYFVAGRSEAFQTAAVLRLLQRHDVAVNGRAAPREVKRFLRRLEEQGNLRMTSEYDGRLTFTPTHKGAWA